MIRVITIGREYGSGGSTIARLLAEQLGWRLVDNSLIAEIAEMAKINRELAARYDESVDPWFYRLVKALWRGGYEGVATRLETDVFDADAMASLWHRVIREAADIGQCVTVGRGGQCILQERKDAFHVFVYAPLRERIQRLRERGETEPDLEAAAEETDRRRAAYIWRHFGQEWTNRHLYDLLICSSLGVEKAVSAILCAAGLEPRKA